jgi:hypothetical protein
VERSDTQELCDMLELYDTPEHWHERRNGGSPTVERSDTQELCDMLEQSNTPEHGHEKQENRRFSQRGAKRHAGLVLCMSGTNPFSAGQRFKIVLLSFLICMRGD